GVGAPALGGEIAEDLAGDRRHDTGSGRLRRVLGLGHARRSLLVTAWCAAPNRAARGSRMTRTPRLRAQVVNRPLAAKRSTKRGCCSAGRILGGMPPPITTPPVARP